MLLIVASCAARVEPAPPPAPSGPVPPVADVVPYEVVSPFGTRVDPYYWLRDDTRQDPKVLAYLEAENAYAEAMLAGTRDLQQELVDEMVARIPPDDGTPLVFHDGYWVQARYETGREYAIHVRRAGTPDAPEEVVLDENERAAGQSFYRLGQLAVTTDGARAAWTEDTVGRRQYTLRFRDLATGEPYPEAIPNVEPWVVWANDHRTALYIEKHPTTLLGYKVRKHVVGTDPAADPVVYEEQDPSFYLRIWKSRSDRFLHIGLESTVSHEHRVADASDPELAFRVLIPRERDHEYFPEDHGDRWVLWTNWEAPNYRIVEVPMAAVADRSAWRDLVPHREDAMVHGMQVFDGFLAVDERRDGLRRVRLLPWDGGEPTELEASEPTCLQVPGDNPEPDSTSFRYVYTSLTTPRTVFEVDTTTGERTVVHQQQVLGGFDPSRYRSEYLRAPARDGASIPVSVVYREGFERGSGAPLLLYGYGSYGSSSEPVFSPNLPSLLDRGVVYAIAHVRGGSELGRAWYDAGRLQHKTNTFTDFVDVTAFLVDQGYAAPDRVAATGRSAGGLLIGAVVNLAPERYRAVVAGVPFVDVVTTMLDPTIPLTTNEYDEWGNPGEDPEAYRTMLSYSPYDNVRATAYPAMLVETGLWDSQVQYFEPAKWVAKLRATKTDDRPLLLYTEMDAGHGGLSGRYRKVHEVARQYAFLLDQLGVGAGAEP